MNTLGDCLVFQTLAQSTLRIYENETIFGGHYSWREQLTIKAMNTYKDLRIWQKSVDLAVKVYEVTRLFPREELYGLTYQLKKSAVSVPSNIAEGSGRNTRKDFNNFLGISYASSCELNTQLIVASRINILSRVDLDEMENEIEEIQKMNWALKKSLDVAQDPRR